MENQSQSIITRPTSITDLQNFLAHWTIQNKIPQSLVNNLLRGLKKFGHPELPFDARTLCDTPNRIDIQVLTGDDCREDRKRFENLILQKVNELLEVVRRNDNPVERTDRHYAFLPQMPFNDINALQRFDRDLKDNGQMRDQFMKKIQDIGGKLVKKAVKYAMEVVMTNDLTQQVVWILGAENKPKISKFTFPYVIIDVVPGNHIR
ncbi:uncharacterized protein LOC143893711 [Temnothorax americanus]|uniref:uncharacterized protein LOC143893711 n=1 Tax=Temnothorax americanus TaxID=1964332 RepID=UPI00406796D8